MPSRELTRLVYRSIIRWTNAADGVPFLIRDKHIADVFPTLGATRWGLHGSSAIRQISQAFFRNNLDMEEEDASEALEAALTGLRLLNTYYAEHVQQMRENRRLHSDTESIAYPVGQVFMHRRHGYTGVVYGWDGKCGRDQDWAEKMQVKHDQPFYQVLPDEDDCQRLYGSIRITKYVAEENIMPLQVPRRITHRLLENFFQGYSVAHQRYVPTSQVQFQYPNDYEFSDIVPCHEDTNLLRTTPEKNEIRPFRPEDQIRRGIQEAEQSLASLKRDH